MGNCFCQLHIHPDQNDLVNNMDKPESNIGFLNENNSENRSNRIQIKIKNPKLNNIELKIKKKLFELGNFIQYNDFKRLIGNEIAKEIQQNKFDYTQYISPPKNIRVSLNPFQFKETEDIYMGSWNEDAELEGEGIFYSHYKKIVIEGFWTKGNNICGRIFFPDKNIYEGAINNSVPNGKGKLTTNNKDIFEGEFKNGEMKYGKISFRDGTKYEGYIDNGNFNGEGKMTWINNIEYKGNFNNSQLSGFGTLTKTDDIDKQEKYEGEFNENEFNGKGKYYFNNGDVYEGDFEFGVKQGHGIFHRNNGDIVKFEGKWNNDVPDGNGIIRYGEHKLQGFWRNGDFTDDNKEQDEIFKNIDKNIKPQQMTIYTSSLSHLNISNSYISQYSRDLKDLI